MKGRLVGDDLFPYLLEILPKSIIFKTISGWKGGTSSEVNGQEWVLAVPGLVPQHGLTDAFPSH